MLTVAHERFGKWTESATRAVPPAAKIKELEGLVEIAGRPRPDRLKADIDELRIAVLLPKGAAEGVPIERLVQNAHRVRHPGPRGWPNLRGEGDPGHRVFRAARKFGLNERLLGVSLLAAVPPEAAIHVVGFVGHSLMTVDNVWRRQGHPHPLKCLALMVSLLCCDTCGGFHDGILATVHAAALGLYI